MQLDFFFQNLELSALFAFFCIESILFIFLKKGYVRTKILGWMLITTFLFFMFLGEYFRFAWCGTLLFLGIFESISLFRKQKTFIARLGTCVFFLLFLSLVWYIWHSPNNFLMYFILVSLGDIVAYFSGKLLPWKRGFFSVSPNKTLSGFIIQWISLAIVFMYIPLGISMPFFLALILGFSAPIWDLLESYIKRQANSKDTASYIPGHGGIFDRLDSSILGIFILAMISRGIF